MKKALIKGRNRLGGKEENDESYWRQKEGNNTWVGKEKKKNKWMDL